MGHERINEDKVKEVFLKELQKLDTQKYSHLTMQSEFIISNKGQYDTETHVLESYGWSWLGERISIK